MNKLSDTGLPGVNKVFFELITRLRQAGLDEELAEKVVDSNDCNLTAKVVRLIQDYRLNQPITPEHAHAIMGKHFFGVKEAVKHFGINPTEQQLTKLAKVPFTEATLQSCKDTHVLIAVFPKSISKIRDQIERGLFHGNENNCWYLKQLFIKYEGEVSWQLLQKEPIAVIRNATLGELKGLLPPDEEIPTAQVLTYSIIGYFLATGEHLFENVHVYSSDIIVTTFTSRIVAVLRRRFKKTKAGLDSDSLARQVAVMNYGAFGLNFNSGPSYCFYKQSVASCKKSLS